jgi:hypothetical protein
MKIYSIIFNGEKGPHNVNIYARSKPDALLIVALKGMEKKYGYVYMITRIKPY